MPDRTIRPSPLALGILLSLSCAEPRLPDPAPKAEADIAAVPNQHDRPIVERDGRTLLWAGEEEGGTTLWFDMTDAMVDPERFQFGIGRDTIPSIDEPEFVAPDDPRLLARGVTLDTEVLGVEIRGEARAYPVAVMSRHEVVNDEFAGEAFAVLW